MKLSRTKWLKDRLYEVYLYLGLDGFVFAICVADVDFQIHLQNCRNHGEDNFEIPYGEKEYSEKGEEKHVYPKIRTKW